MTREEQKRPFMHFPEKAGGLHRAYAKKPVQ